MRYYWQAIFWFTIVLLCLFLGFTTIAVVSGARPIATISD